MTIAAGDLRQVLEEIWSTQLGMELAAVEEDEGAAVIDSGHEPMTGIVELHGAFGGAVHVGASRRLVRRIAAAMFSAPGESLGVEDLRDALGELTNMLAGNLKTLLDGHSEISLPTVVDGLEYDVTRLRSVSLARLGLVVDGEPMVIGVLAQTPPGG